MNNYIFIVEETLARNVCIKASSKEEAYSFLKELYLKEEIVLDSSDYVDSNIEYVLEDNENDYDYTIEEREAILYDTTRTN